MSRPSLMPEKDIILDGSIRPTRAQVRKLHMAYHNVILSIPADVRHHAQGVELYVAELGEIDGRQTLGAAHVGRNAVIIHAPAVDEMPEGQLENLICHELAHLVRDKQGVALDDYEEEEEQVEDLTRSWGFRVSKQRRRSRGH